jgi:predicted ATPase
MHRSAEPPAARHDGRVVSGGDPGWQADSRAVRLVRHDPGVPVDVSTWPGTVPAVEQVLCEGLELPAGVTVLVGENGSGKSTVVEMLAEACGLNPQGGSAMARLFRTRDSEPGLGHSLIVERGPARPRWSYFLRADTMHTLYGYLEDNPGQHQEGFHELSHGEGFLEILRTRVNRPGFYLMDEPDAPLSFTACLGLVALLHDLAQAGSQAVVATHSPIVAAVPGASILELGDWGIRTARWEELHLVTAWRRFLTEPGSYFRHLFAEAAGWALGSQPDG